MKTLILDGSLISLQAALAGAITTTNPTFVTNYADNLGSGITEGATDGALNGVTDVTIVPAPSGSNRRIIKNITIFNGDTAAVTVLIKYDNNATQRTLVKVTLAVGDTWTTEGVFDTNGSLKQTLGTVNLSSGVTGTLPIANGGTGTTSTTFANLATNVTGTLPVANGGTGQTTYTNGQLLIGNTTGNTLTKTTLTAGSGISITNGTGSITVATSGVGDVVGPASSTDNAITRFDSTTGKLIQNSLVTVADDGAITAPQVGSIIPFYYVNQAAFPSAATYHGAVAHSHSDGAMYFAHSSAWVKLLDDSTDVTVSQGGTGASTLTGVLKGNGTAAITAATAGTDYAGIDTAQTFTKGQRGEITVLTDGATITPDLADSNNFSVTLGGNRTLANPTNTVAGQSGSIFITQDGTGSRTLAYGTNYDFAGGTAPTLSTTAGAIDRIDYVVRTATSIHAVFTANYS
jgi:hypothetical protein